MPLSGEAKKDYQRRYMEGKRSNSGSNKTPGLTGQPAEDVRPVTLTEQSYIDVETGEISDGAPVGLTGTKGTENTGLEGSHSKGEQTPSPCSVEHLFDPDTGLDWQPLKAYISKPTVPGAMSNLERLQRVAGALGQRAEDVRFGLSGPTFAQIGKLLGKEEALWPR